MAVVTGIEALRLRLRALGAADFEYSDTTMRSKSSRVMYE
jgi:hypothetical protein